MRHEDHPVMMALPGGPANKLGNRYEKWWTLSEIVRMLEGKTDAIHIEDPGVEKAEFVVAIGLRRELHQAKRSHPSGKWSLATLKGDGLLEAIGRQLAGNEDRFVFVSGSDAPELSALCDAASGSESPQEFERRFLSATGREQSLQKLSNTWACGRFATAERLRRIRVRTIGERELVDKVRWGVQALFLARPNEVVGTLWGIVEDSVCRTITREGLVDDLNRRGYRLRRLTSPASAGVAVRKATDVYLNWTRARLIRQRLVPRAATKTLLSRLEQAPATDSVVTGKAGAGKTACIVEVIDGLRAQGLPVLAFRIDRVLPASTTTELGGRLDLEESPVLVLAAAAEAADRPGVLIVDQVDAVSTMSGRSSEMFDLAETLLREARGTRRRAAIHAVVVCRAFDWMNDPRLRQLVPDTPESDAQIEVAEFTVDDVKRMLTEAGFSPASFQPRQIELLRLPQNLSLFLEAGFDGSPAPAFRTAKDLFDRYWGAKRQSVQARVAPLPDRWMEVIETLCDEMTVTQQLAVAKEKLDDVSPDYLRQMASEGVLDFDGHRYGFGHESFFDYVFARVFVRRSDRMVAFLKKSDQHLFRRAQVRQVLAYLRDADRVRYVAELRDLLSDDGIRPHLKDLAIALLAEVTDPSEEEWAIWEHWTAPALRAIKQGTPNPNTLSAVAWHRFFGARPWFADADRRGVIDGWLASGNDRLINAAVSYLRAHQHHSPDRVSAMLEPYADCGGEWPPRLRFLVEWADHHTSRRFFDLFLHLVDNGSLDEARGPIAVNSTFWSMLHDLGKNRPAWVPEVLAHRLRRRLAVIRAVDVDLCAERLIGFDQSAAEMFSMSAARAPEAFVQHVLPVVLDISDSTLTDDTPPKRDAVWPILMKPEYLDGEGACLSGLADALAVLAREGTADLREVIDKLRRRDTHVANHLLLSLYAGGAARYADEEITLLCDEPWRFQCGFADSPNWCAMEVIRAVVPHSTTGNRERLEAVILGYVAPCERTRSGYRQYGRARFALLSAIPSDLRSYRTNAHFGQLARKFSEPAGEPRGSFGGLVGPPIGENAADRMTDDQWLSAIAKHGSSRVDFSGDGLTGGAPELARVLETQAKEQPERFARLSLRFPAEVNPVYVKRTLDALASAKVASELKLQVCRKAFAASRGPCGGSIADLLGSIQDPLPNDALHMVRWLATEHQDPATEAWQEDAGGGRPYYNGDVLMNGINTTRGRAAGAIRDLILMDAACVDRFRTTLDRMIRDPSASVRACVAGTVRAVAFRDPALGLALFLNMDLSEDRLLATDHVCKFVHEGLRDSVAKLRRTIERMLGSAEAEVCETGARLASIAALHHEDAADLARIAMQGSASHRLGVAQVASANLGVPECRAWSAARLTALFDDDDPGVRRESASCFRHLDDETLDAYIDLMAAFCDSRAFQENSSALLYTLEGAPGWLPGTMCMVCERFLDRVADDARDVRTLQFADAHTVAKLIFRTYQQHQHDEWTPRALDLIDRLCLERIGDAEREFEKFER